MLKVENHHNLFKTNTGAVVNADKRAYERAKARKADKERVSELEEKVERLERMLERILDGSK